MEGGRGEGEKNVILNTKPWASLFTQPRHQPYSLPPVYILAPKFNIGNPPSGHEQLKLPDPHPKADNCGASLEDQFSFQETGGNPVLL